MDRAYSILEVKGIDEDSRVIRGVATSPEPDRVGDIVEPLGVEFKNPMPLLWQHKSDKPVGLVKFDKPSKKGITFEASLPVIEEPGALKDRVDEAWQSVKAGLVRAVSIGFRALERSLMEDGGFRFIRTEVLELSLVTIPANAHATITSIKAIDAELRAQNGVIDDVVWIRDGDAVYRSHGSLTFSNTDLQTSTGPEQAAKPAGSASRNPVKAERPTMTKKTIAEQISAFEATRVSKSARMDEIMDAAAEKGETLDDAGKQEYDDLGNEVKEIEDHLVRLRAREKSNLAAAKTVEDIKTAVGASEHRSSARVQIVPRKLPEGIPFTRYVISLARAKGDLLMAERQFRNNEQWMAETPEVADVLKVAVDAGTTTGTTWAAPLVNYQIMVSEFVEYLRPLTVIGRIPGLRRVPFKIKIPRQTGAASVNWVGEGKVKPLTSMAFDTITMEFSKIAGIIPLTEELVRFSNPSAEALVREELAKAIVQFMDSQFLDPTKAANDVSPASITNSVTPDAPSGTTAAAFRADIKTLLGNMLANNHASGLVWIMTQQQALALGMMQNSLGQAQFPGLSAEGGTLFGFPVVTSENIPAAGGSPTDGYPIILVRASDILLADDGQVSIDASREASLQMETTPDSPATASTNMVSLWQHNLIAIKAERYVNWAKARSTSVDFIQGARYAE
jgi:HK97 family phage major capsid protein/HK97 family phage prohead protease